MSDRIEDLRQETLDLLARRYAEGILDEPSFDRAVQSVQRAQSPDEILAVSRANGGHERDVAPAADPGQSVSAILTERSIRGDWIRHRYVTATTIMGSMTLDLRDVTLTEDTRLHVLGIMGEIKILLPPSMPVVNEISAILAEHNDRSRSGGHRGTGPTLRLTGTVLLAEITVSETQA